ncbi:MAG: chromosome segregation protein SMC [Cocleimonas sp.]
MRLSKIKIAGFKSFVDPTTIDLRSNLTGVVGPNGCGKSNVIDAVRWVMGESSAKHLRGASMDDVIFNGSSSRKPIGQATIELLFDNSDATLGGEYAKYSEIAIKRLISRDGQSKYFLNGSRCRRRDITDIFLGTGLGPRSYAIIEQGMISRLIEAKPEELRSTLEEAAGISKYKERRRETERRIKNTRENLDRLTDLRDELEKQLAHLNRQAKAAEKFKTFKEKERRISAELILLRLKQVQQDIITRQNLINEKATKHQAELSEQRSLENQIESKREEHSEANEVFNKIQASFYQVGSEISRLEQTIKHQKELEVRHHRELEQVNTEIKSAESHASEDQQQLESAKQQLLQFEPKLEEQRRLLDESTSSLSEAEQKLSSWQSAWNKLQQKLNEPAQQAQVERARMEQLETQLSQIASRLIKLQSDQGVYSTSSYKTELVTQSNSLSKIKDKSQTAQQDFNQCKSSLQTQVEEIRDLQKDLQNNRSELQSLSGKLSSLLVLQDAGLGKNKNNDAHKNWLVTHKLEKALPVAETIQIETGWELALEVALGGLLESLQLESNDQLTDIIKDIPDISSSFLFNSDKAHIIPENSLASKLKAPKSLHPLLYNIHCVESLDEAIAQQADLASGATIITRDGLSLGSNWLKTYTKDNNQHDGVLARQKEIDATKISIKQQQVVLEQYESKLESGQATRKALEQQQSQLQTSLNNYHREESQVQSIIHSTENRIKQTESNKQRIIQDVLELGLQQATEQKAHEDATHLRNKALSLLEILEKEKSEVEGNDSTLQDDVNSLRQKTQILRDSSQQIQLQVETHKTIQTNSQLQLNRFNERQQQLHQRKNQLLEGFTNDSSTNSETDLNEQLETQLEKRTTTETELSTARDALQNIDNTVRELEGKRHQVEQKVEEFRSLLETLKMEWQEVSVREKTLQEQFDETEYGESKAIEALLESMSDNITLLSHQQELEKIQNKVARLGAINLAAIEEFKTQNERKKYLDEQDKDLMEALQTLESAIAKIDRDTRSRFKDTFEKVNSKIQEMFPQLFGGGKAHLEMTGDDLLTTGISIMAQPPGKRITSIHLMSGGEKALTAVAMVFAIFELNPAPFCMLDEVDAPLDEANVGRFCQLVRKMSDRVQFIFITHNKTTMELSENLIGVTMREPGVSRLVSVDLNEAERLAQE